MKRTDEEKKQWGEFVVLSAMREYARQFSQLHMKVCEAISGCNFYDVEGNLFHVSVIPMDDKWFERKHEGEESLYEEK